MKPVPSQQDVLDFLQRQAAATDFAVTDLAQVRRRTLQLPDGKRLDVQFNPARMRSTGAKISSQAIAKRPCFLCRKNRPAAQLVLPDGRDFEILVNPFPILPRHLTIVSSRHEPQRFAALDAEMCRLAWAWEDFVVFYNGPFSGASAPDHAHLQAGARGQIPVERDWEALRSSLVPIDYFIYRLHGFACPAYAVVSGSEAEHLSRLRRFMGWLSAADGSEGPKEGREEPDVNIVTFRDGVEMVSVVFHRRSHRPACYYAEDATQRVISPGAVDMGGLLITPRAEDFENLTPTEAQDILREVAAPFPVSVGLLEDVTSVRFRLNGDFLLNGGERVTGEQLIEAAGKAMLWQGRTFDVLRFIPASPDATFTLPAVPIGREFHWERTEVQTFEGTLDLKLSDKTGFGSPEESRRRAFHVVNLLPVERYLRSVISSEMKATAGMELLKAHAVISRSWLMRQFELCTSTACLSIFNNWFDSTGHESFDVCADDHCQRYQGLARLTPEAEQAVRETAGCVLTYGGKVCDARFSKCCGGRTEVFSTCWDDEEKPYLQSVADSDEDGVFCDTKDVKLLSQVLNSYDLETRDFYRWTKTCSQEEISALVEEKGRFGLGDILDLIPVKRGPSGRICKLRVVGTEGTVEVGKELVIRRLLSPSHLYSSAFDVEKTPGGFVLHGKGWGHGVGLCQIGAAAMADKGYDYRQILMHYYRGAQLTKLY